MVFDELADLKQYSFLIQGEHVSGKKFRQEYLVISRNKQEADEELHACLDSDRMVRAWKIQKRGRVSKVRGVRARQMYEQKGPFTIYDPDFGLTRRQGGT